MREFTHRVANDWASAIASVSLAAKHTDNSETKSALASVAGQLQLHAELLRALQAPKSETDVDAAGYLERLCLAMSCSKLESRNIRLVLAADPLPLEADRCWRLGMIVFELVSNAARHGFNGRDGGLISVDLRRGEGLAECCVTDSGSAPRTIKPGNGLQIVRDLAGSLRGTIEQNFGPRGSSAILRIPVVPRQAGSDRPFV